jgi:hypothetical protein
VRRERRGRCGSRRARRSSMRGNRSSKRRLDNPWVVGSSPTGPTRDQCDAGPSGFSAGSARSTPEVRVLRPTTSEIGQFGRPDDGERLLPERLRVATIAGCRADSAAESRGRDVPDHNSCCLPMQPSVIAAMSGMAALGNPNSMSYGRGGPGAGLGPELWFDIYQG